MQENEINKDKKKKEKRKISNISKHMDTNMCENMLTVKCCDEIYYSQKDNR